MTDRDETQARQQIAQLRRLGESNSLGVVAGILACVCAVCLLAFALLDHRIARIVSLLAGGISGLLAIAVASSLSRIRQLARATRTGRRVQGTLALVVDRSDSDHPLISGSVKEGPAIWQLHFAKPPGWEPENGEWPCEMVFLSDQRMPSLVQLPNGILVPTAQSRKTHAPGA